MIKARVRSSRVAAAYLAVTLFSIGACGAEAAGTDTLPALAREVASLEQSATQLSDVNEIKRLQRIYGYYLDRSNWEDIVALLTDDATAEYGASGVYVGKASIRKLLYAIGYDQAGLPKGLLREHMQFQPVVDLAPDGRTAKGRWRVFALLGKYGEYARWQAGPYENEYRKEGGVWKISKIRWYETFTVPFDGAWKTELTRANLGDRKIPPADRPSTSTSAPWPAVSLPPYHYSASDVGRPCCVLTAAGPQPFAASDTSQHLASLSANLQRLEDERDVETLQRSYGYYVDKNRWDEVTNLFVDDGTLEIGGRGVFVGKKRIRQYLEWLGKPVDGRLYDHTQLQPVVNVAADGKTAKGRWRALIFTGDLTGSVLGDAIYENEYRKEGGKWKIATLRAYFLLYTTLERGGWDKFAMANTRPEKDLPPDLPPRLVYDTYPGELSAPYHFGNPVTGAHPAPSAPPAQAPSTDLKDIRARLSALADAQAIENLQNAYGYYIDKWQWDDAASLFAENATYEVGQQGVYSGRAHIRRSFELMGPAGLHQREVNDRIQYQPVIHVAADGLTAKARTRQLDVLGKFGSEALLGGGTHENEYVKVNGVWKISKLHLYTTFLADLGKGGWARGALPAPARSEKLPPDAPPTQVYSAFPKFFVPEYHYPGASMTRAK